MRVLVLFLMLMSFVVFAEEDKGKAMEGYSTTPLTDPIYEYSRVVVEVVRLNNWLVDNYQDLDEKRKKGPREHLYYLLSSYVSNLHGTTGRILPDKTDPILERLLFWSEKLNVYGGHLFYNQIKGDKRQALPPLMPISEGIAISALDDMYVVASKTHDWSVKFPYYFMLGTLSESTVSNGMKMQMLVVSTGGAKDKTVAKKSQATLVFLYSPTAETDEFKRYWTEMFAMDKKSKETNLGLKNLRSFYLYDKVGLLHKEITFLPTSKGSLGVVYMGMDGSYQKNRPHFLNFLSSITLKE